MEQNALALRDSLVNMTNREGILWFNNDGYQKGTKRDYDSVNIYDKDNRVIGIFKKQGVSFYKVNLEDYMELLNYKIRLETQKY
jgi:hypothetical protein